MRLPQVDAVTSQQFTFHEVKSLARSFGSGLIRMGGNAGDVVALVLPNTPEYAIAFMGAAEAGFTITTLNPVYTPSRLGCIHAISDNFSYSGEIQGQLLNSGTKYLVTSSSLLQKVKEAVAGSGIQIILVGQDTDPSCMKFDALLKDNGDLMGR